MSKKKQKQAINRSRKRRQKHDVLLSKPRVSYSKDFSDQSIPTEDYLSGCNLNEAWGLEEALDCFVYDMEQGYFLDWQAVVQQESGLPITDKQKAALDELMDFNDDADESRILYINDRSRPNKQWYEIVWELAPRLLKTELKTCGQHYSVFIDGWERLVNCLELHGCCLSLPDDVQSPLDVVPRDLQHRLWLQSCCGILVGIGQYEELSLEKEDQSYRIDFFIECLKKHHESVKYLDLTLEKLLTIVILPASEKMIFIEMMMKSLGLSSMRDSIADVL